MTRHAVNKAILRNIEHKFFDETVIPAISITASGAVIQPLPLTTGTTESTRIGATVIVRSMFFMITLQAETSDPTIIRIIIFKDKSPQGFLPLPVDLLESVDIMSPLRNTNKMRFSVLYNRHFNLPLTVHSKKLIKIFMKKRIRTMFLGTSTLPMQNAVFILFISDSSTGPHPSMTCILRTRYTDA